MNNMIKKGFLSAAAFAIALTLVPARPAQAKSRKVWCPGTVTESYQTDNGKWVISEVTKYTYKKKGLETSHTTTYYDTDVSVDDEIQTPTHRVDTTYNKYGLATTVKTYRNGKQSSILKNNYKKKRLKSLTYSDDSDQYRSVYHYKKGKLRLVQNYENGKLYATEKYSYKGKKVKKIVTRYSDGDSNTAVYTYKKKKLYSIKTSYSYGRTYTVYYNKKGLITKNVSKDSDGTSISTFKYNSHGDPVEYKTTNNGDTTIETRTYKYYKKKYVKEEIRTSKNDDGSTSVWKIVYSDWKQY